MVYHILSSKYEEIKVAVSDPSVPLTGLILTLQILTVLNKSFLGNVIANF